MIFTTLAVVVRKAILFAWCSSTLVIAGAPIRPDEHVPSPNKELSITYRIFDDARDGDDYSNEATLYRGRTRLWSLMLSGRGLLFAWSPDSRFLLIGFVQPDRDMALYWLDASAAKPQEHDLVLDNVQIAVKTALPPRRHKSLAGRSQIDFDRIQWLSPTRCRLPYHYSFDNKSGDALFDLNLAEPAPTLKIGPIISTKE